MMGLLGEMIASQRSKTDWPVRATHNWDADAAAVPEPQGGR